MPKESESQGGNFMRKLVVIGGFLAMQTVAPQAFAEQDGAVLVADIAPVHSMLSALTGQPENVRLLLPAEASAHHFALRPSDARALSEADLLVWVGDGLTPWLGAALETVAESTAQLELMAQDGWEKIAIADTSAHDEHDGHEAEDKHDHGEFDPHAWLDPTVMIAWGHATADALAAGHPAQAALYQRRAGDWESALTELDAELASVLADVNGAVIVPHDAYRYLARRYGLTIAGAIAESDAADPGLRHVQELAEMVESGAVSCVLGDRETGSRIVENLVAGSGVGSATVDPMGAAIALGPENYAEMMRELAQTIADCASGS